MPHVRPEMPAEVARWLESNDVSSAKLREKLEQPTAPLQVVAAHC
jgi:hypothetical protein